MTTWTYRLHGIDVTSDIQLAEPLVSAAAGPASERLRIVLEPPMRERVPACLPLQAVELVRAVQGEQVVLLGGATAAGTYVARWPGVMEAELDAGRDVVTVRPDPEAPTDFVPVLVGASLLSFVLAIRGCLVLHASCVEIGGDAVAVVADSGGGKSTLSGMLCAGGTPFVSDDVLRVACASPSGVVTVFRGSSEIRLRSTSSEVADVLAGFDRRTTADGRTAVRLPTIAADELALRCIVLPVLERDRDLCEREQLSASEALMVLLSKLRVGAMSDAAFHASHFEQLAELVNRVSVFRLRLPWARPLTRDHSAAFVAAVRACAADACASGDHRSG